MSEGEALEAMDVVELVQVSKTMGKSLEQGKKEQLGKQWNSRQLGLSLEGSSWSSCMEVERSCHDGSQDGNCLGS